MQRNDCLHVPFIFGDSLVIPATYHQVTSKANDHRPFNVRRYGKASEIPDEKFRVLSYATYCGVNELYHNK